MERVSIRVGDVIWVNFPFSNLKGRKTRPALVLAKIAHADLVLCQITSVVHRDRFTIKITTDDFSQGTLNKASYVRVAQMFTANKSLWQNKAGRLNSATTQKVGQVLSVLFKEIQAG